MGRPDGGETVIVGVSREIRDAAIFYLENVLVSQGTVLEVGGRLKELGLELDGMFYALGFVESYGGIGSHDLGSGRGDRGLTVIKVHQLSRRPRLIYYPKLSGLFQFLGHY